MIDVIQQRLGTYNNVTLEDEENALKEISQEVVLYALAEAGFFEYAAFIGGTCLRINHGLDRFSEDLDFSLREAQPDFDITQFLEAILRVMKVYGYNLEMSGSDKVNASVKSRFLKDDSIKKLLVFEHKQDLRKKLQIKLEVDINPPPGSSVVSDYLNFPTPFMIMTHDLSSLLAGKIHALLCRTYTKGRDWYDYLWYLNQKTKVNFVMLENALNQQGPWKGSNLKINKEWLHENLNKKVKSIDWIKTRLDVENFLRIEKRKSLEIWSEDFFTNITKKFISHQE